MLFIIDWTETVVHEDYYIANSFEEAKEMWEREGHNGKLFFIQDAEEGDAKIYGRED